VYHGVALFLYVASSVNLLVEVNKYSRSGYAGRDTLISAGVSYPLLIIFFLFVCFLSVLFRLSLSLSLPPSFRLSLSCETAASTAGSGLLSEHCNNRLDAGSPRTRKRPLHNRVRLPHIGRCVS